MPDQFWVTVKEQLGELGTAKDADDVCRILSAERNPYEHESIAADGFFAGGDGDDVREALEEAGWLYLWVKARYWFAMEAPDGSAITYVEGDIYKGNRLN
jgi:hypothetical protein